MAQARAGHMCDKGNQSRVGMWWWGGGPATHGNFLFPKMSSPLVPKDHIAAGPLSTVDFGTPSYKFTVNICTYLIF
jgi:hypothetical protein